MDGDLKFFQMMFVELRLFFTYVAAAVGIAFAPHVHVQLSFYVNLASNLYDSIIFIYVPTSTTKEIEI